MLRCSHILKYAHPGLHTHVLSCPYVCKHMPLTAEPRAFTTVSLPFTDLTPIPSEIKPVLGGMSCTPASSQGPSQPKSWLKVLEEDSGVSAA